MPRRIGALFIILFLLSTSKLTEIIRTTPPAPTAFGYNWKEQVPRDAIGEVIEGGHGSVYITSVPTPYPLMLPNVKYIGVLTPDRYIGMLIGIVDVHSEMDCLGFKNVLTQSVGSTYGMAVFHSKYSTVWRHKSGIDIIVKCMKRPNGTFGVGLAYKQL